MPFSTERKTSDSGVVVLALSGTMTIGNQIQQLEWSVDDLIKDSQTKIVFDMAGVRHIDSSAIGVLISCHGKAKRSGGALRIAGVQDRVRSILEMVNLHKVLTLDPSANHAVAALAGGA